MPGQISVGDLGQNYSGGNMTGGYGMGRALCTIPALWVGVSLFRPPSAVERGNELTARTAEISRSRG